MMQFMAWLKRSPADAEAGAAKEGAVGMEGAEDAEIGDVLVPSVPAAAAVTSGGDEPLRPASDAR